MKSTAADPRGALLGVYRTPDVLFVGAEGCWLIDEEGNRYLDFTSGIGVNALGHGHPAVKRAIADAVANGLLHASNLFRTRPAEELARRLADLSGLDQVFFCNSGAEAVEGALKFAKKWAKAKGGDGKHRIVALRGGFHGRLHGSLAVTDRPDFRAPFEPLMPAVDFSDPNDPAELDGLLDPDRTAALIVEPIQGEGGIRVLSEETLRRMRAWTAERGIALILDEIQCGLGRTGTLFAFELAGIEPDLVCIAKPLAGGLPMGAVLMTQGIADAMSPGDHGTTFGGGVVVASAALAVLDVIAEEGFLDGVRERGGLLGDCLNELRSELSDTIREVRGRGLMWGIELENLAGPAVVRLRKSGLLSVPAGSKVVRLLPPLTVSDAEIERAIDVLRSGLPEPGE